MGTNWCSGTQHAKKIVEKALKVKGRSAADSRFS